MASPIVESWIHATILIESEYESKLERKRICSSGTAFLVLRRGDDKPDRVFLVTNKHVLAPSPEERNGVATIKLHMHAPGEILIPGKVASLEGAWLEAVPLNRNDGSKCWREHPDGDVDVLAIDVTQMVTKPKFPTIGKQLLLERLPDYSLFADRAKILELDITIAEEILVIGYPLGLQYHITGFPVVRGGIIGSRIGEPVNDYRGVKKGGWPQRVLRGFMIDGAIIPGSSGSPVVLKPTPGRLVKGGGMLLGSLPPLLLGIVSDTTFYRTDDQPDVQAFARLGFAFDAETVKETIELFFQ